MKLRLNLGRIGSGAVIHTVPRVRQSTIGNVQPDGITVVWDRPMEVTCDIKSQINVLVNGNPTTVTDVVFHPNNSGIMGILVSPPFHIGETVTWAYDDNGSCVLQEVISPNAEAENQTYGVYNDLHTVPTRWYDTHDERWEDENGIPWTTV